VSTLVVGAGPSGLHIARLLHRAGEAVTVLESRSHPGGRLRSVPVGDARLDLGATWWWPHEHRVAALISELDIPTFPQHLEGDTLFERNDGRVERIVGNRLDVPAGRLTFGMDDLTRRMAAELPAVSIHCDATVVSVDVAASGVTVRTRDARFAADHVVVAVPPMLAMHTIEFSPELPERLRLIAASTPVWMGDTVKAVVAYRSPFWRDDGLAGAAFSYAGPLREIHDMSGPDGCPAALFGFASPAGDAPSHTDVVAHVVRLFGPQAGSPLEVHIVDWRRERSTVPEGSTRLQTHRQTYGHPLYRDPQFDGRLHWCATETASEAPGHVEGALEAAERVAAAILHRRTSTSTRRTV
jgi:monoamine oxidase